MEQLNYYNQICDDINQLIENKFVFDKAQQLIKTNEVLMGTINTSHLSESKKSVRSVIDPEKLSLSM